MFKWLLPILLLITQHAWAISPNAKRIILESSDPLANIDTFNSYVDSLKPTMDLDPEALSKVTLTATGQVSAITSRVSAISFTQGTAANQPYLSRPDQVENIQLNAEALGGSNWFAIRSSISANSTAAPDGTTTADTLIEDSSTNTHLLNPSGVALTSGVKYRFSGYGKAKERTQIRLLASGAVPNTGLNVDLSTCTEITTTGSPLNKTYTSVGNGWCRFSFEVAATSTASGYQEFYLLNAGSQSYAGDGASGLYLWGAQLQRASMQPSYIQTTASPIYGSLTGRRGLVFDGSNDQMTSASYTSAIFAAGAKEAYIITDSNTASGTQVILRPASSYFDLRISGAGYQFVNYDGTGDQTQSTHAANRVELFSFRHASGYLYSSIQGGPETAGTASGDTTNISTALTLGHASTPLNGNMYRFITFNKTNSPAVRAKLQRGFRKFYKTQ